MGKITIPDNYKATYEGEEYTFNAVSDRQAWYLAYEWTGGELLDSLEEIDQNGQSVRSLMEER